MSAAIKLRRGSSKDAYAAKCTANSGGVIVSYFEWVQGLQNFFWELEQVLTQLKRIITQAFDGVYETQEKEGVTLRTAALMKGVSKVSQAMLARGLYP